MNVFVYQEYTARCLVLLLSKEWPIISKYVVLRNIVAPSCIGLYLGCVLYIHLCTIYIFEMAIVSRIQFVSRHMWFFREVTNLI